MPLIIAQDVWKRFRIPHEKRGAIVDNLNNLLSIFSERRYNYEEFWALRQVSFSLERGESLGIVGPNGSGKSTLLKLMARVMKPDRGEIETYGSTVPILELGIGFQGDLTVKENATIYGIILGLRRSEIRKRIDSILDFAGLARFQDAKLKTLSSGMQVRLGFSIVIETEADIFLIDEALAVGDMEFQRKCLDRFREFKNQGKTIVLVSHGMDLINDFCEKTIYLSNGEVRAFGPSPEATSKYLADMNALADRTG
jgi:lipopolysaccharide transport system ATP-binding protein